MPFLKAEWRDLVMVNWSVPQTLLAPLVPDGCQLDEFEQKTYVSLVAFLFKNTRVMGLSVPGHRHFEEVNLRFYVTRTTPSGEIRRGVVFIREYVPKPLIAMIARWVYHEPYYSIKTSYESSENQQTTRSIRYQWGDAWLSAEVGQQTQSLEEGSLEYFIAEHYWGYTRTKRGTREYRVEHPPWKWRQITDYESRIDYASLYGANWSILADRPPDSVFLAEGSEISVSPWGRLKDS